MSICNILHTRIYLYHNIIIYYTDISTWIIPVRYVDGGETIFPRSCTNARQFGAIYRSSGVSFKLCILHWKIKAFTFQHCAACVSVYIDDVRARHNINIIVIGVIELRVRAAVKRTEPKRKRPINRSAIVITIIYCAH